MSLLKMLPMNFSNKQLITSTLSCLLLWSSISIPCSSGEVHFHINNDTFPPIRVPRSKSFIQIVSLNYPYDTKDSRNSPIALSKNYQDSKNIMKKNLFFIFYKNGKVLLKNSPGIETSYYRSYANIIKSCVNEKISFIFHGWTESCTTEWVPQLIERLTFHRGGCIICVDYNFWSKSSYINLLQKFNPISEILYEEVLHLIEIGFNPSKMFMFGFSYGGQIASKIGHLLKPKYSINKMDVCDMAGPGFDFLSFLNHSAAADNVQCYYSSLDKGSHFHSCHQNIRLGLCGYTQPAILSQPYFNSHGLCVRIYINTFDFPFYAFQNSPHWCERGKTIKSLPQGFTVGYREGNYSDMIGDIFVPTSLNYPYNLSKREIILYKKYLEGS